MAKKEHSYRSGRIQRAGVEAADGTMIHRPKIKKKKRRKWPIVLTCFGLVFLLSGTAFAMLYKYADDTLESGTVGVIRQEFYTEPEFKGDVANILIVGIDNEEGRGYGEGLGLTDMILYANLDLRNGSLNMLQIPRDSYVGTEVPTGGSGKINAALISGPDQENPINNLVEVITTQYKLPVDYYVSIDMDGMKAVVDAFGGIKVYVPKDMEYGGSRLEAGWRWLNGEEAEFFVRNRKGTGFERADLDRLDNQRHFYSALFRRLLNLTTKDIIKLMPVFRQYCNTDIGMDDLISLAVAVKKLSPEKVMFCKVPGVTGPELDPTGQMRDLYFVDKYGRGTEEEPGVANLLNQYFRTYGEPVPAAELMIPDVGIPDSYTLYPPNVQVMGQIQEEEGGTDIQVEPE